MCTRIWWVRPVSRCTSSKRGEPVRLERRVVRDAGAALGHHRELVVRLRVPADRGVDGALERVGVALHQRVVDLVDVAVAEGVLEHRVGVLGLADHHHARRADVEPLHDPLPLRGAAGRDLEAGRGQVSDHGRAGPAGRRVHGDAHRLADHHDRRVVVDDLDALDLLGYDVERVGLDGDGHVDVAPASTRSLLAVPAPSTCTRPRAIRSAARVRESPNIWASAASTRSPASPSGTGRVRWSALCRDGHDVRGLVGTLGADPRPVEPDPAEGLHQDQRGRDVDAHVGDVEDRPVRQHEEVDDVPAQHPGGAEEPVGEVAGDAGQQQPETRPPTATLPTRRLSQSTTRTATIASRLNSPV